MNEKNEVVVYFEGALTEEDELPKVVLPPGVTDIVLDLRLLKSINSIGIRSFIAWVTELPTQSLWAQNCPNIFIQQLNTLTNFLPDHARVRSFFAPYFSEATDEELQVLYKRGTNFSRGKGDEIILTHPEIPKTEGSDFEIDVNPSKYFSFLKKHG